MGLRALLKESIRQVHTEVEDLEVMKGYSSAELNFESYQNLLHRFYTFWTTLKPRFDSLPEEFKEFHDGYLNSISKDCSQNPSEIEKEVSVNEFSFFYILLGSAMGASVIIKNYKNKDVPHEHLVHLSQKARPLWSTLTTKLKENFSPFEKEDIIKDSIKTFEALKQELETCEAKFEA